MNGIILGIAMLVSSTGVSPATETSPPVAMPSAINFELPVETTTPRRASSGMADERSRPVWQRGVLPRTQASRPKKFSTTDRVIAVAAGVAVGWVVGGVVGYAATANHDNPDDDTSGLRGVIIGAPIGATAGAILGWRLTDR